MTTYNFILFLLFFNLPHSFTSQGSDVQKYEDISSCDIDNIAFQDNEELRYKVYYNWGIMWLSAAEVVFKVKEKKDGYHISAVGKTYSSYEWLYKVDDKYEVYIDKETLLPKWAVRKIKENNYTQYEKMVFNQAAGTVTSTKGKTEKDATTQTILIKDCAHDVLSIIYFVRNYPFKTFKAGQSFPVKVFLDRETNNLTAKYNGIKKKQEIKGMGTFNTYSISPGTVEGKVFEKGNTMKMLISEDPNHIPLLIESKLSVGSVKIALKSYKNLRYPLNSKID